MQNRGSRHPIPVPRRRQRTSPRFASPVLQGNQPPRAEIRVDARRIRDRRRRRRTARGMDVAHRTGGDRPLPEPAPVPAVEGQHGELSGLVRGQKQVPPPHHRGGQPGGHRRPPDQVRTRPEMDRGGGLGGGHALPVGAAKLRPERLGLPDSSARDHRQHQPGHPQPPARPRRPSVERGAVPGILRCGGRRRGRGKSNRGAGR
jgi:hypothetical protein